jgi:hypothetical protein
MAVTIRAALEADDAKKGLQELGQSAEQASDKAAGGATEAEQAVEKLADAQVDAGNAAEKAGNQAEEAAKETADAAKEAEKAARAAEKAEKDASAAAEVAKLRRGEATKEIAEGLAIAAERFQSTGDVGEAAFGFLEKAAQGLTVLNPAVGITASIAVFLGKAAYEASGYSEEMKKAAEEAARAKANAEALAVASVKAATQARLQTAALATQAEVFARIGQNRQQMEAIRSAITFVTEEMAKAPPHLKATYEAELQNLKVEQQRGMILDAMLTRRQGEIKSLAQLHEMQKRARDGEKAIADAKEAAHETELDQLETEEEISEFIQKREDDYKLANKAGRQNHEEQRKWLDEITQAERKLRDNRKKALDEVMAQEKQQHEQRLQMVKEREQAEIAMRQHILEAEVALQQHLIAEQDKAQKAKEGAIMGSDAAQQIAAEVKRRVNDEREIQKRVMDEREKEARDRKAAELGLTEAQARSNVQVRRAGQQARRDAAEDWRTFQRGGDKFNPDVTGAPQSREDFQRSIDRAKNEIQADVVKEFEKWGQQQRGINAQQAELWKQILQIVTGQLNTQGANAQEIAAMQAELARIWAIVQARENASRRNGADARRRQNGR